MSDQENQNNPIPEIKNTDTANIEKNTETKIPVSILHSLKKETQKYSQEVVKDKTAVTNDEAVMLADLKARAVRRNRTNFLVFIGFCIILTSVFLIVIPDFFVNQNKNIPVPVVTTSSKFIPVDTTYDLPIPNNLEMENFNKRKFSVEKGISKLDITRNNQSLKINEINTFLPDRFINGFDKYITGKYVYGLFTDNENNSIPFLAVELNNRERAEDSLKNIERTIYTDLNIPLQLDYDIKNETRTFETFKSIKNPYRELRDIDSNMLLVYGFVNDSIVVFTKSPEVYVSLRERIITDY